MRNFARLTNAANRMQAWQDWNALASIATDAGLSDLVKKLTPPGDAGWRKIDKQIALLRYAMRPTCHNCHRHPSDVAINRSLYLCGDCACDLGYINGYGFEPPLSNYTVVSLHKAG